MSNERKELVGYMLTWLVSLGKKREERIQKIRVSRINYLIN
jgi:hypothetical protein